MMSSRSWEFRTCPLEDLYPEGGWGGGGRGGGEWRVSYELVTQKRN